MRTLRKVLATFFGLAGAVGFVLCVAGVVACWAAYFEAVKRVDRTFGRVEDSLGDVRDKLTQSGDRLRQTRQELDTIRLREVDLAAQPPAERTRRRSLSRKTAEDTTPQIADVRQKIVTATEVALVANGLLDVLAEVSLCERVGVETNSLRDASAKLEELIVRSEKLAATLARASPEPAEGAAEESSRMCGLLDRVVAAIDEGANRTDSARSRVRSRHEQVLGWISVISACVTLVLVWIGIGQLSLMIHGYTGVCRRTASQSDSTGSSGDGVAHDHAVRPPAR